MGNIGEQFISKASAVCKCLPKALEMVSKELFKTIENGADFSAAVSTMIKDLVQLQKCVLDNGFNIQDNKPEIMAGDLSTEDGWVAVPAAELDLIRSFFTNYLTKSKELMADKLVMVFNNWINIFAKVENRIKDIRTATENLFAQLKAVPDKIEEIEDKVCTNDTCQGPVISEYFKKVSETIATIQTFHEVQNATETIIEVIPKATALIESTIEVAEGIPDVTYFLELIESYPLEFTTDSSGNVRAGLTEIQALIETNVLIPFRNVTDSIRALEDVLDTLPIKEGKFDLKAGVASYRRWSTVSMDLPCTRQARQEYTVAGVYKGSFDYPEFYSCKYGPKELPWANHHVPYFKFRIQ
ncbi:hypothetical protein QBC38DRAFT_459392 [Podospora fimiseda]|uniref:Uncharacterized protein n=1 Tax=Podospora fimiseda TaxID=252190 RepID=A0AAN7BHM2_9PEZI|nr:hypothetical protein QBC38DRAFT_459392 [Podospora fimiseda]